ncbi:glucose-6-phosphate dehydrogenase assembly protein OpcA [Horticoccus luteus]|uniref:Glucose-6-phosphate dehydrogenase assembly protein OpcA n=1 Tax=Horticoccus luteus TaxID=2862869 RepID=A0A8F9XLH9_9BACT|nr:glucose-6-phosphate dehydrogenase assembly protein OpcA [Horticoccus luteus]QYM80723.1 glucose-6-phosphate dehydrogenase assembly protein OpcA [Horticoccus luteus]
MPTIFDALPGVEVPVDAVAKGFEQMWSTTAAEGGPAPDDATATQVNFVLHLGFRTTPEDALAQFQTVVRFARRYPSRVVVLCPLHEDGEEREIHAKIYGECFLGRSKSDKRCVEFVLLSYPRRARQFLESQVSVCLSADLPMYYWAHRFSENLKLADYRYLLTRARRVMIDSAIAPAGVMAYPWPHPNALRDLVYSRLLPVRQTVGQFLASYPPDKLVQGLETVTVEHTSEFEAEARVALAWLQRRLAACGVTEAGVGFRTNRCEGERKLAIQFKYAGDASAFAWHGDFTTGQAGITAVLGGVRSEMAASVSLLTPEAALSEAMFF